MWFEGLERSQRRRQRKQLWSHRRSKKGRKILHLVVTHFIVRPLAKNKFYAENGFWCFSLPSPFFRSSVTVSQGACCVLGLSTPREWPVRVEGKSKRPSDNWFIKSVWGVEQEPRGCFADVTNCDKITSATQATIRDFKRPTTRRQRERRLESEFAFFQSLSQSLPSYFVECRRTLLELNS